MSSMSAAPENVQRAGQHISSALRVAHTNQPTVFARYIVAALRQLGATK